MLKDPTNIFLEKGSHLIAFLLDLVGEPDHFKVDISKFATLPNEKQIFRHRMVLAQKNKKFAF